jgi:hypothetical protein
LAGLLAVVAILCVSAALFPGEAQWVNDESLLLQRALDANAAGRLATHGLGPGKQVLLNSEKGRNFELMTAITTLASGAKLSGSARPPAGDSSRLRW